LTSTHPTDPFGALQAISQELAFLSPQSVASISTATAQLIRDHYTLESRGPVAIKGIGEVETFLIV
jgi:hypothetical protein